MLRPRLAHLRVDHMFAQEIENTQLRCTQSRSARDFAIQMSFVGVKNV